MTHTNAKNPDLQFLGDLVFKPLGLTMTDLRIEVESKDYDACTFRLNGDLVVYRKAKITSKKIGQFVTTWKRNSGGVTVPFDGTDPLAFLMIAVRYEDRFGVFLFPKHILHQQGILSEAKSGGKRGFRLYPIWDLPTSKQAIQTQLWQSMCFVELSSASDLDLSRAKLLLD